MGSPSRKSKHGARGEPGTERTSGFLPPHPLYLPPLYRMKHLLIPLAHNPEVRCDT